MASTSEKPDYVLGRSNDEKARLLRQANILRTATEQFCRAGGIAPGMNVLDLGCGMGDVSLLASELVGASGSVIGIDRDPTVIEQARQRGAGVKNVRFEVANIEDFAASEKFDAVIGRYVLLYQADPSAVVRAAASIVKPGGLVVFHEVDFTDPHSTYPPCPLWDKTYALLCETFRRGNNPPDFGRRLGPVFLGAGVPFPTIQGMVAVGGGEDSYLYDWIAMTARSLMPRMKQFALATEEELDLDTLSDRMRAEVVAKGAQIWGPTQFGAWVRKP